jgi:dimethylaniline monooxygenase (N-oxide forming)
MNFTAQSTLLNTWNSTAVAKIIMAYFARQDDVGVDSIQRIGDLWHVCRQSDTFSATKVMVATGICCLSNMPTLVSKESFGGLIVHTEGFGDTKIMDTPDIKNLVALGAGNPAADIVYEGLEKGKTVHWVIRTLTGTGRGKGPFKNAFEAAHTRIVSSLGPSIFNPRNCWTKLLQNY